MQNHLKQAFAVLRFGQRILQFGSLATNPAQKLRFLAIFGAFLEEFFALRLPRLAEEKIPTMRLKKVAQKMNKAAEDCFLKTIAKIPQVLRADAVENNPQCALFFKEKIEPLLKDGVAFNADFSFKNNILYVLIDNQKIVAMPRDIPLFLSFEEKIVFLSDLISAFTQNTTLFFAVENMLLNIPIPFDLANFESLYLKEPQAILLCFATGDLKTNAFLLKSENHAHFLPLKQIFGLLKTLNAEPPSLPSLPVPFLEFPKNDVFLNHPYHNFDALLRLTALAANDEKVSEIYISLYRTIAKSQLIQNLKNAAKNGKKVSVFIELLARQDERDNIHLFNDLKQNGVLVYSFQNGYKLHAKTLLIKRENHLIAHIATGNYNEQTATQYIDCGIITRQKEITKTIYNLFQNNFDISNSFILNYSPKNLHEKLLHLIKKETAFAKKGKRAKIVAKINALTEPQLIKALQNAAENGVKIRLIIRGASLLKPQKNIQIISVLGRYLEHARIIYFYHNGKEKTYISSADWMPRNLFSRTELLCPILNKKIKRFLIQNALNNYFKASHFEMQKNGHYIFKEKFNNAQIAPYQKLLKGL